MSGNESAEQIIRNGVAVVTGASAGLGQALAIEFTARGIRVAGFARREDGLNTTAKLCHSGLFTPVTADVGDEVAVKRAFDQIRSSVGEVTILINNAAVYPRRDFLDETPTSFAATMAINLGGVVSCTHTALETMVETGIGRIVNVGSFADLGPIPCSSAYSVSKGAARIFTRALVADIGDRFPDIVITTWMPGILATDMGLATGIDPSIAAKWGVSLALWHDPALNGTIFDRDREVLDPLSLKQRIKNLIMFRKVREPRRIQSHSGS